LAFRKSDCFNVPSKSKTVYDIRNLVSQLIDTDSFFEIQESFATSLVVGFARIGKLLVGKAISMTKAQAHQLLTVNWEL
jgi:propionyl-CoA carboxylase beta chain